MPLPSRKGSVLEEATQGAQYFPLRASVLVVPRLCQHVQLNVGRNSQVLCLGVLSAAQCHDIEEGYGPLERACCSQESGPGEPVVQEAGVLCLHMQAPSCFTCSHIVQLKLLQATSMGTLKNDAFGINYLIDNAATSATQTI